MAKMQLGVLVVQGLYAVVVPTRHDKLATGPDDKGGIGYGHLEGPTDHVKDERMEGRLATGLLHARGEDQHPGCQEAALLKDRGDVELFLGGQLGLMLVLADGNH